MFHMFMFGKYLSTCDQIEGKNMHLMSTIIVKASILIIYQNTHNFEWLIYLVIVRNPPLVLIWGVKVKLGVITP